jgi:hypothetical protein
MADFVALRRACGQVFSLRTASGTVEVWRMAELVQRSMFDAVTDSQPARRANGRVSQRSRTGRISDLPKGEFAEFSEAVKKGAG